jgi:hypothetical protein
MSASYDGTILDHLAKHMLYLSTASSFWFSLSLSHDHGFHLSQRLGITPHDYTALLQRGGSGSAAVAAAEAAAGVTARWQRRQRGSSAVAVGSAMVVSAARWLRWQRHGRALAKVWRRRRERGGSGGGGVVLRRCPAWRRRRQLGVSMASAAAAQSTIN